MKKFFLAVIFLGATMMVSAQHVNPLDSLSTNLQIDSMRIRFASDAAGMVAALQMVEGSMQMDDRMLKDAQRQLKDETAYAKSLENYLKTSKGVLENLQKAYDSDIKDLNKMQSATNDQLNALHKLSMEDQDYKSEMESRLNGYLTTIHDAMDRISAASRGIDDQLQDVTQQQTNLDIFNQEIATKQEQLKAMQEQHKANKETVKNELKVWKKLAPKK